MAAEITTEVCPDGAKRHVIIGESREVVQRAIDNLMDVVDFAFGGVAGSAHFRGPYMAGRDKWCAFGTVRCDAPTIGEQDDGAN